MLRVFRTTRNDADQPSLLRWLHKIFRAGYNGMAVDRRPKTPVEFVALVKECTKRRDLEGGTQLHRDAVAAGFKNNKFLCSVLITMYKKCGSIELGREVFDGMTHKDVVVWTSLILGYAENGQSSTAMDLFTRMDCEPNSFTYVAALKACGGMASEKPSQKPSCLQTGMELHNQVKARGFDSNMIVSNTLLDMYCKCGNIHLARNVFDKMSIKSVVTWNCLMSGYVHAEDNLVAMELLQCMDCKPDAWTYAIVLKACGCLARASSNASERQFYLEKGMVLHRKAVENGFGSDTILANTLVDMYGNCGSMVHAREVFDRMPKKNVVTWNALILGYVENGESWIAVELFTKMDCEPSPTTYVAALKAYAGVASATELEEEKQECLEKGIGIHKQLKRSVADPDIFVESALVDMYSKCGSMRLAREVFDRMSVKDVVTWTALILGYVRNEESSVALDLFSGMGCAPNNLTYAAALKACGRLASEKEAEEKQVWLAKGMSIHEQAKGRGLDGSLSVGSSLVEMYAMCGNVCAAREVFDKMAVKNAVTWTYLILAYVESGESLVAVDLFEEMDCEPDSVAYVAALKACGSLAALRAGQHVHTRVSRAGMEQAVANSLMGFYGKCGNMVDKVEEIFSSIAYPNVVSWNALMAAYSAFGDSDMVFRLARRMHEADVQMNGITFICILTACSHSGLVERGKRFFEFMLNSGVSLTLEHYNCMVDMLGRANRLREALALIRSMPSKFKASDVTWRSLLGACRKWKNVVLGKVAFDGVMATSPKDSSAYVLMSDLYGSLRMWEPMEQLESARVRGHTRKVQEKAWWCDGGGGMVEFVVKEEAVEELHHELVDGYEYKDQDCGHSEKLALAHAIVHTPPGEPIRIVKNMRVCIDCHDATKQISKAEKREIIVREASRFHVFRDGVCSCGDFW